MMNVVDANANTEKSLSKVLKVRRYQSNDIKTMPQKHGEIWGVVFQAR